VISGQHLHGFKVTDGVGFNFVSEDHAERLKTANVRRGDVIFTHAGNIGQVAYIHESSEFERYVISQRQFYMRCDRDKVMPEFVVAFFKSPEGQHQLLANTSQVGVPSIAQPVTYLRTIEIPLPPLSEQRAITHILGTLDDKIELNRRMSVTLEAIARALFKAWFVDFDPVRAKAEGRDPGLPQALADLFPARLVDSELGEIPEGWEVKQLSDICDKPQYGYTASASDEPLGPRFLRITDINKRDWIEWHNVPYCSVEPVQQAKYALKSGDIVIARIADPGHGALIEEDANAIFASYLIRFRPVRDELARFLQYWLRSDTYWNAVRAKQSGTTRSNLNAQVLSGFHLVVPTVGVLKMFGEVAGALRNRLVANARESLTLAALRNALLPKLVSGELSPFDIAERFPPEGGV
jgi:type I restriction enzyme, S subunit